MSGPFGATPWMYDHTDFYPLDINQSLKFNDDESQYLSWTPAAAGNRKTWTWSAWVKTTAKNTGQAALFSARNTNASANQFHIWLTDGQLDIESGGGFGRIRSSARFRDPSSWYHFVIVLDATNSATSDKCRAYVNGVRVTDWESTTNFSNRDYFLNSVNEHAIGKQATQSQYIDGYLSEVYFIDGQALAPTNFGEFKEGIWIPKVYNGTYGNNGFHLPFKNDDTVEGFNAVTYRGTGATQSISGLGFSPDLIWHKGRTVNGEDHYLFDTVRGAGKALFSTSTSAGNDYGTGASSPNISFDSDGVTMGNSGTNTSGRTYVAWAWDAGSGSPVSNTDGTITSTVKANPAYGFSIVSWTGTGSSSTVGHGLSSTPELIINKNLSAAENWVVYSTAQPNGSQYLRLNSTNGLISDSSVFGGAANSTTFTVGTNPEGNGNGNNHIAYCFAEVAGYSSIGSYSGSGSAGKQVTGLGFKPAWLMIKSTTVVGANWVIWDNTRSVVDPRDDALMANGSDAEFVNNSSFSVDFLSDGFELNSNYGDVNQSGASYIYIAFADTRDAAFWRDTSGNNNNWTPNNLDYRDSLPDSTTNNFNTANVLAKSSMVTLSEGNLKVAGNSVTNNGNVTVSPVVTSGKWYFEYLVAKNDGDTNYPQVQAYRSNLDEHRPFINGGPGTGGQVSGFFSLNFGLTNGDILGIAVDADGGTVKFYDNNSYISGKDINISAYDSTGIWIGIAEYNTGFGYLNFGQDSTFAGSKPKGAYTDDNDIGSFQYAPPAGYLALCTQNLPTPTIIDGSTAFNTTLWAGNGVTGRAITGVGHQPDFLWVKGRNLAISHYLQDSVRGATKYLYSDGTNAEGSTDDAVDSFDSDGFTLGNDGGTNASSYNYVGWSWKAGGTAVSNTNGSITSQVSANVDAGFSIVSYSGVGASAGATVGHGLNQAPELILPKNRGDIGSWHGYHSALGGTKGILLNSTNAAATDAGFWNNTNPTSSVFTVGTYNVFDYNYIAYCFHSVEGFSKVSSYTGNGSTDGAFVYTGFRPAWVLIKWTNGSQDWTLFDNKRPGFNETDKYLHPSSSAAEGDYDTLEVDLLSNGFKCRGPYNHINTSGGNYIYLAFAENPFKYSNAR